MISKAVNSLMIAGSGDDVILNLSDSNSFLFGGDGGDLMVTSNFLDGLTDLKEMAEQDKKGEDIDIGNISVGNIIGGDDGNDVILSGESIARLVMDEATDTNPLVKGFRDAYVSVTDALDKVISPVKSVLDAISSLSPDVPLPDLGPIEIKANIVLGGGDDDVLGGSGLLSGEAGNDTYVAQETLASIGVDLDELELIGQTPSGDDVIELRNFAVDTLTADEIEFVEQGSMLQIKAEGDVVANVFGMDVASNAVETLRVVDNGDVFEFDLDAIWDNISHR